MHRSALKPDAQPLAALGGPNQALSGAAMRLALQRAGALLDCLERLLSQPAALPVPVPGQALLQLACRILAIDDTLAGQGMNHALNARQPAPCTLVFRAMVGVLLFAALLQGSAMVVPGIVGFCCP